MQIFIHYVIPLSGFAGKIIVVYECECDGESARGFDRDSCARVNSVYVERVSRQRL